MVNRNHWFHMVFCHFIKYLIIKLQAFLIGRLVIPVRENTAPGNGQTETLKSHFCKQSNVFFIMVIKIYCYMAGIIGIRMHILVNLSLNPVTRPHLYIIDRKASSSFCISALILVCRCCAAPQKIFAHFHSNPSLFSLLSGIRNRVPETKNLAIH